MSKIHKSALIVDDQSTSHTLVEDGLYASGINEVKKISFQDLGSGTYKNFDYIFVNCNFLNADRLSRFIRFAGQHQNSRFLVLAQQISIHAYRKVSEMKNVITLQVPCESSTFQSLLKEIIKGLDLIDTQRFPRFVTDEPARILVMDTGLLVPTRMRNYSVGGAFLEYKGISLKVGHRLDINLLKQEDPPSKNRLHMSAKIIWVRLGDGKVSSSRGVGVQFVENLKSLA